MKNWCCSFLCCIITLTALTQEVHYQFSAPNASHHEAEITITADGLTSPAAIFKMSRSSPGRYAKHEFGKNVYNVRAQDPAGKVLKIDKADADVFRVTGHKGSVKITYTLYGDYADGTYASIDASGYHLNMPACFMWVKGLETAPITIQFAVPDTGWKIATQLKPTSDPYTFTAPSLQYFMDSPTKIGLLHIRHWTIANPDNKSYTFRLALEANATDAEVDGFTEKLKRIVLAAKNVYGELPSFDYGTYTFLASIHPFVRGDGMEHRNSTMITIPSNFTGANDQLSVFAHEFFHCWNVERIRPKSLEPFNFEKSNMSEALWLAEGFTQYYGTLVRMRAGLLAETDFLNMMAGLVNAKTNTPGARFYSPVENSQRAVFVDAGVSIDRTNYPNMFTSYYAYGGAIALALDMELRSRFDKSLDDLMKELWKKQGRAEIPYNIPDVQNALARVSNPVYAAEFFKKYIYGYEPIDYKKLLAPCGLSLITPGTGKGWIGVLALDSIANGLVISRNTVRNTPLYQAGLDAGDLLVELNGKQVKGLHEVNEIVSVLKPGAKIPISYYHRKKYIDTTITLSEDPTLKIVKQEDLDEGQRKFFTQWIGGL